LQEPQDKKTRLQVIQAPLKFVAMISPTYAGWRVRLKPLNRRLVLRAMCKKCLELDKKIERGHRMAESILTDRKLKLEIKSFIADLEREKSLLHPRPDAI